MQNNQKLVSIIVPVYNSESYLNACLESVLNQKYKNIEIILVNDGSKDSSLDVCQTFQKQDSRIQVYSKPNGGVSSARNLGIEQSGGDFICFIDSDDVVSEDYISDLLIDRSSLTEPGIVFQMYESDISVGSKQKPFPTTVAQGYGIYTIICNHDLFSFSAPYSKLFDTEIIKSHNIRFPLNIHLGEDYIFTLNYLKHINQLSASSKMNYFYQTQPNSLTKKYYDFHDERRTLEAIKASILDYLSSKQFPLSPSSFWVPLCMSLLRCATCDVHANPKSSLYQQYRHLKEIPAADFKNIIPLIKVTSPRKKLVNVLLTSRMLFLFCVVYRTFATLQSITRKIRHS